MRWIAEPDCPRQRLQERWTSESERDEPGVVPRRPAGGRQPGLGCRHGGRADHCRVHSRRAVAGHPPAWRRGPLVAAPCAGRPSVEPGQARGSVGPAPRCGGGHPARSAGGKRRASRLLEPPLRRPRTCGGHPRQGTRARLGRHGTELLGHAAAGAMGSADPGRQAVQGLHPVFQCAAAVAAAPRAGRTAPQEPTGLPSVPSDELADWELLPTAPDWSPRTGRGLGTRREGPPASGWIWCLRRLPPTTATPATGRTWTAPPGSRRPCAGAT